MKQIWKYTTLLLLVLLCTAALPMHAGAVTFPELRFSLEDNGGAVILSRVPTYDNTGSVLYTVEGGLFLGTQQLDSFRYTPAEDLYHMPEREGYLFRWADRQVTLSDNGTYVFRVQLIAKDKQNPGTVLEKGPVQELSFVYSKPGDTPVTPPATHEPPAEQPPAHEPPPPPEGEYNPIIDLCLDANGGTFRNHQGMDLFDGSMPMTPGITLASTGYTIDRITCAGQTFQGWIAYNSVTGKAISGLLTTQEVLNYVLPNHNIRFEIQWEALDGYPITAITYAAIINGTGEADPNVRVTLENNGIRYSGYGYVTISKEVYSQWKGNVKVIWECPGQYIRANNRWIPDYFESEGSASSFKKEKSCYNSISATGKGKEVISPRDTINELFYSARNTQPELSLAADSTVSAAGLPHTITAQQLQSGSSYETAMADMKKATLTDNVLVYDITARNDQNVFVHQLDSTAEVTIQLPESYIISSGNTALVYYLPGDGTATPCDTTYDAENHQLTFRTDHFSLYAVAEVAKAPEAPSAPQQPNTPTQPDTPLQTDAPGVNPVQPAQPPAEPLNPSQPADTPVQPSDPVQPPAPKPVPDVPAAPVTPTTPEVPVAPSTPAAPEVPTAPSTPAAPEAPATSQPAEPTTPDTPSVPAEPVSDKAAGIPTAAILAVVAVVAAAGAVLILKKHRQ